MQEVGRKKKLARCFKKFIILRNIFQSKKKKNSSKKNRIFSLASNIVYWLLKSHSFEFFGVENTVFFEPKS